MDQESLEQLFAQLEPLGYYKYATEEGISWALQETAETGRWYSEGTERVTWGDGEAIAEWGAWAFLQRVMPMLMQFGVPSYTCEQPSVPLQPEEYTIKLNGIERLIFPKGDPDWEMLWVTAPARTFALVEQLLREANSAEHIYTPKGEIGQESSAIFLTEEMYNLINTSPLVPDEQTLLTPQELLDLGKI